MSGRFNFRWRYITLALATLAVSFAFVFSSNATGIGSGVAYAAGCTGTDAPDGTDCSKIPLGCPGTTLQGPVASGSVTNCPYISNTSGIGCNGSNAPLNTDCSKIPLACPGSTQQGPTTGTPANCPYSSSDLAGPTPSNVASSPDCNTNGDPMTWVLCPIYDALSGAADWLFTNIVSPFLVTEPVGTSASDSGFQIWSNFRVYGDIILVIAVLVVVIGQSIGGGIVDAYTAKKVLPRVLITAILINLSVYIVAFLVDITNILGKTIGDVLTEPIRLSGQWNFTPNAIQSAGVFGVGLLGLLLSAGGIAAVLGGIFFSGSLAGAANFTKIALYAAMWVILPIVLAVLAVFVTLVIRKGLILFLLMTSPVWLAFYCLPNLQPYGKKAWDLLVEALMVYPIIVVVFAVADILAVTILGANSITSSKISGSGIAGGAALTADQVIAVIVAFFLQFLPLLAIPFAFRMAGGTLSKFHEVVTNGGNKLNEMATNRKEMAKRAYGTQSMQGRENVYNRLNSRASQDNGLLGKNKFARAVRRGGYGFLANRAGGYNLQAAMSAQRAQWQKEIQDQIATGVDVEVRALTVDKATATESNGRMRTDQATGQRQYKTLGGAWVNEADVDRAKQRWGGNQMALQEAVSYEMKKATTQEEVDGLVSNFGGLMKSNGINNQQATGVWKGAAFANQGSNLEYKYYSWKGEQKDATTGAVTKAAGLQMNGQGLITEIDEKKGSYDMGKMSADTWVTMQDEVKKARATQGQLAAKVASGTALSQEEFEQSETAANTLQRASRIARTYAQQRGMGGGMENPETGEVIAPSTPGVAGKGFVTSIHGAPGRVQEEAENFVQLLHPEVDSPVPSTYAAGHEGAREMSVVGATPPGGGAAGPAAPGFAPRSNPANTGRDRSGPGVR